MSAAAGSGKKARVGPGVTLGDGDLDRMRLARPKGDGTVKLLERENRRVFGRDSSFIGTCVGEANVEPRDVAGTWHGGEKGELSSENAASPYPSETYTAFSHLRENKHELELDSIARRRV